MLTTGSNIGRPIVWWLLKEEGLGGTTGGMRGRSLPLEGASEVVLSLEEEGFLFRCLVLEEGLRGVSTDDLLVGTSLRDGLSFCTYEFI